MLLASGYIAGGAIAGIVIAFIQGVTTKFDTRLTKWAEAANPFFSMSDWNGLRADWLALLPFLILTVFLYLVGRELLLKSRAAAQRIRI